MIRTYSKDPNRGCIKPKLDNCFKDETWGEYYYNHDCIKQFPEDFDDKQIGSSSYKMETYEDKQCSEIREKAEYYDILDG